MYDILKTIKFLGHQILKNETVSKKLLSFYYKMTKKKNDLGHRSNYQKMIQI